MAPLPFARLEFRAELETRGLAAKQELLEPHGTHSPAGPLLWSTTDAAPRPHNPDVPQFLVNRSPRSFARNMEARALVLKPTTPHTRRWNAVNRPCRVHDSIPAAATLRWL